MSHSIHDDHSHTHSPSCGHARVAHEGHEDFLHDGHLHHVHGDHVDDHVLAVGNQNPAHCTPKHACTSHDASHVHGASCGHEVIPHGDHVDYLVDGHLHSPCSGHCDDHGTVDVTQ